MTHPYQRKLNREVNLKILDNNSELVSLERKRYVKYLGVLIDGNLSWKHHISYISTKISKGIGIIARLRHLVPCTTLLTFTARSSNRIFPMVSSLGAKPRMHI